MLLKILVSSSYNQALKANFLFTKDKDYLVKDSQVVIVDEFTGRMMEGRSFLTVYIKQLK